MAYKLSALSKSRLAGVNPLLIQWVLALLEEVDFSVSEGIRDEETQARYYKQGVTKTMNSKHLVGKAVDIYPYPIPRLSSGEIDSNHPAWNELAEVGKKVASTLGIELTWGGDWKSFIDKPHWELK